MTKPSLLLSRPAVIGAVSLAAGIVVGQSSPATTTGQVFGLLAAASLTGVATLIVARRRQRGRLLPNTIAPHAIGAALLLATVGFVRISAEYQVQERVTSQLSRQLSLRPAVIGTIADAPTQTAWSTRFLLDIQNPRGRVQVDLTGRARERWGPALQRGDTLEVRGPLDARIRRRNPTDFDYGAFLFSRSVVGAVSISNADVIASARRGPTLGLGPSIARLRERILANVSQLASERTAPVLRALLLDDRTGIDAELSDALSKAGLMHLLSVSGLHVMLVGFALYRTLFSVLVRLRVPWQAVEWIRTLATLALLCLYAALTGNAPPVNRSVIMAGLLMGQTLVRRQADTLNVLGMAASLMLVHRPAQLFDVGFQLSFAAVAAIVVLGPGIRDRLTRDGRRPGFLAQSVAISTAATVGTAPIVIWTFGYVSSAGTLLNVAAVPLASAALGAGLLMVMTQPLSHAVAAMFARTADISTELILLITDFADDRLSAAVLYASSDPYHRMFVLALVFVVVAHAARWTGAWRWTIGLLLVATVSQALGTYRAVARSKYLDVVFVDVGQGDGAIIRTPGDAYLVVDTGPSGHRMAPMLRSLGAERIDALLLSHPHADHDGGVEVLTDQYAVTLTLNNGLEPTAQQSAILQSATPRAASLQSTTPQAAIRQGVELKLAGGVSARVLSPPDDWPRDRPADELANNHSVVLRLDYGEVCFLFAGDIESEAEADLVARGADVSCEVVKVPHHGSRTSSTWPFVRATATSEVNNDSNDNDHRDAETFAVLSVGAKNRFGHPAPEVVDRWRTSGRVVVSTADGARWFRTDGHRVWLHRWR